MKTITDELRAYDASFTNLGDSDAPRLARRLKEISERNDTYFNIAVLMLVILFGAELAIVVIYVGNQTVLEGIAGIFGVSVAGSVLMMRGFWKEKVEAELLALACELDPALLRQLALKILGNVASPSPAVTAPPSG